MVAASFQWDAALAASDSSPTAGAHRRRADPSALIRSRPKFSPTGGGAVGGSTRRGSETGRARAAERTGMARRGAKKTTRGGGGTGPVRKAAVRGGRPVSIPGDLAREVRPDLWDPRDPSFNLWAAPRRPRPPARAGPVLAPPSAARPRLARHPHVLPPAHRAHAG